MPLFHYLWSRVAANNATADAQINWQEGQAPSSVNDSARALMASAAGFRDDISGAIVTGGTSTAYTVTSYQVFNTLANMSGQMIAFTPHATNTGAVTLNIDGLGAKPIYSAPDTPLLAGTLILGTPYVVTYRNDFVTPAFVLQGFFGNPYNVPLGSGMDYWGATAPNSSFVFPIGQAISRTTYATLFTIMGTTYGVGDGSTTFNLPDKTGRVSAMKEASATRLTSTYFVGNSTNLGATGGVESNTIVTANLPPYTPSGSVSSSTSSSINNLTVTTGGSPLTTAVSAGTNGGSFGPTASNITSNTTSSFTGSAQGGVSTPLRTIQPTIICNYIIRII